MLWLRIPSGTPLVVNASALCMMRPRSCAALLLPIDPRPRVLTWLPYEKNTVSCITNTASPQPAIRAAVASQCGCNIPAGPALGLLNSRYAACVLAHVPHASLMGEDGDLASCCAVFSKRRSRRLSRRSARANSWVTHSTDSVPAAMIACRSGSSQRLDLPKRFAMPRRTSRLPLHYARKPVCVQRFLRDPSKSQGKSLEMCVIERWVALLSLVPRCSACSIFRGWLVSRPPLSAPPRLSSSAECIGSAISGARHLSISLNELTLAPVGR